MVKGLRNTAAGASPIELRRGMEAAVAHVVAGLAERSQAVSGDAIRQVATVSAGGDEEVGRMVAEAMDRVSVDGVITVEESDLATELEVTEGWPSTAATALPISLPTVTVSCANSTMHCCC